MCLLKINNKDMHGYVLFMEHGYVKSLRYSYPGQLSQHRLFPSIYRELCEYTIEPLLSDFKLHKWNSVHLTVAMSPVICTIKAQSQVIILMIIILL